MKTFISRILTVSLFLTISFAASAQFYVGGSVAGAYANSPSTSVKASAISLNPEVGYSFNEKWAVGGRISYGKTESVTDSPYLKETDLEISLFTINPYAAYSPVSYKGFSLWVEFGVEMSPAQRGADYVSFGAYVTPLLTYSLNDHFILKTSLDFAGLAVQAGTNGDFIFSGAAGGDDLISLGDDLSIGVVYRF
ncbi:MAG: porin family protein [Bacteroidales bacterium]|nr:porin family protein [Bacteroidales bacterium]